MLQTNSNSKPLLLTVITILLWFSVYAYVPILTVYSESMGASYSMIGIILSSYGFLQLLCRIPLGILSDTLNKRKVFILFGLVTSAISSTGLYFFSSPEAILLFRSMSGLAVSTWAIYVITFVSYFSDDDKAKSMGIINAASSFGQVTATFLGGIIALYCSERATFSLSALAALMAIVICSFLPESKVDRKKPLKPADFLQAAKDKNLLFFSAMAALMQVGLYAGVFGFMPTLLRDLGADNFVLGLASTFATLPGIFSAMLSGTYFKRKWGLKNTAIIGFVLISAALILMVYIRNITGMLVLQLITGFSKGLLFPTLTTMAISNIPAATRSSATAFFQAVYGIGMTIGPIIAGFFSDWYGMIFGFWIVTLLCISGAGFVAWKKYDE